MHHFMRCGVIWLVAGCLLIETSGCSFFASSRQQISVTSDPSGAQVTINGERAGATPLTYSIPRKQEASILITKPGYISMTRTTSRTLSGTGIADVIGGCIILLPFLGLISEGAWAQEPANMSVVLSEGDN